MVRLSLGRSHEWVIDFTRLCLNSVIIFAKNISIVTQNIPHFSVDLSLFSVQKIAGLLILLLLSEVVDFHNFSVDHDLLTEPDSHDIFDFTAANGTLLFLLFKRLEATGAHPTMATGCDSIADVTSVEADRTFAEATDLNRDFLDLALGFCFVSLILKLSDDLLTSMCLLN